MIPGLKKSSELANLSPKSLKNSKSLPYISANSNNLREGSPKRNRDREFTAQVNTLKLIKYGASHLGAGVSDSYVWLRGAGGVLNRDMLRA